MEGQRDPGIPALPNVAAFSLGTEGGKTPQHALCKEQEEVVAGISEGGSRRAPGLFCSGRKRANELIAALSLAFPLQVGPLDPLGFQGRFRTINRSPVFLSLALLCL